MKTLAFAALFYAVTFASLHGTPGIQAETISCDDEPGMEQCNDESTSSSSSSSSSSPKEDRYPVPKTIKLVKTIAYIEPTVSGVWNAILDCAASHERRELLVASWVGTFLPC